MNKQRFEYIKYRYFNIDTELLFHNLPITKKNNFYYIYFCPITARNSHVLSVINYPILLSVK